MKNQSILFLSALDFKEKSIQVIRKTPEAFAEAGWQVDYVVARDNSKGGTYFYEREFSPKGVNVDRFSFPLDALNNLCLRVPGLRSLLLRLRLYLAVWGLFVRAIPKLKKTKYDVVYGYETQGVLALALLRLLGFARTAKVVHRFQGSFCYDIISRKRFFRALLEWDSFLALKLPADLIVMTNDGTQGDKALAKLNPKMNSKTVFWVNGVDIPSEQVLTDSEAEAIFGDSKKLKILSLCRLEKWKRLDRVIEVARVLKHELVFENFSFLIVGEGNQRPILEERVQELNLTDEVTFAGAIPHSQIMPILKHCDIFISTYDFSNVGNPLLEAIRTSKIIFTLNNGDTAAWINSENGFIYPPDDEAPAKIARDIVSLQKNLVRKQSLIENIKATSEEKLWTWDARFSAEVSAVSDL